MYLLRSTASISPFGLSLPLLHNVRRMTATVSSSAINSSGLKARNIWSEEEDARLQAAVSLTLSSSTSKQYDWERIASILGSSRSPKQCCQRWSSIHLCERTGPWQTDEDQRLLSAYVESKNERLKQDEGSDPDLIGKHRWKEIAEKVQTRSARQCSTRYLFLSKKKNKSNSLSSTSASTTTSDTFEIESQYENSRSSFKKWSPDEDIRLVQAVEVYGTSDWKRIADAVGNSRTNAQCRSRYIVCIDPRLKKGNWTMQEDELLKKIVHQTSGKKRRWADVAAMMNNGRSQVACRQRFLHISNLSETENLGHQNVDSSDRKDTQSDQLPDEEDTEDGADQKIVGLLNSTRAPWTPEEDTLLFETVTRLQGQHKQILSQGVQAPSSSFQNLRIPWGLVSECLPSRSTAACAARFRVLSHRMKALESKKQYTYKDLESQPVTSRKEHINSNGKNTKKNSNIAKNQAENSLREQGNTDLAPIKKKQQRQSWTEEEDTRLRHAMNTTFDSEGSPLSKSNQWVYVAAAVGSGKTPLMCERRWKNFLNPMINTSTSWTLLEDLALWEAINHFGVENMPDVASRVSAISQMWSVTLRKHESEIETSSRVRNQDLNADCALHDILEEKRSQERSETDLDIQRESQGMRSSKKNGESEGGENDADAAESWEDESIDAFPSPSNGSIRSVPQCIQRANQIFNGIKRLNQWSKEHDIALINSLISVGQVPKRVEDWKSLLHSAKLSSSSSSSLWSSSSSFLNLLKPEEWSPEWLRRRWLQIKHNFEHHSAKQVRRHEYRRLRNVKAK